MPKRAHGHVGSLDILEHAVGRERDYVEYSLVREAGGGSATARERAGGSIGLRTGCLSPDQLEIFAPAARARHDCFPCTHVLVARCAATDRENDGRKVESKVAKLMSWRLYRALNCHSQVRVDALRRRHAVKFPGRDIPFILLDRLHRAARSYIQL